MANRLKQVSFEAARLIIGYLHNSLTVSEKNELDEWICLSNENMQTFNDLTDGVDGDVFDPEQLLMDTEEATTLWVIAGIVLRQQEKIISDVEQIALKEWIEACDMNKELYEKLQSQAALQKLVAWSNGEKGIIDFKRFAARVS